MLALQRQTIRKGRFRLLVPGGGQNRNLSVFTELAGKDCYQRKQSQQYRCGARNCQIAPLTLRLHPQMLPRFFKCDFQPPARHKPINDLILTWPMLALGLDCTRVNCGCSSDMSAIERESYSYNPFDFDERLRFDATTVTKI